MVTCKIKFIQGLLQLVLKRNTCQVTKYAEFGDETLFYTDMWNDLSEFKRDYVCGTISI